MINNEFTICKTDVELNTILEAPDIIDDKKKYRIWETKLLSTDADSSTDTTVGWTKNTQKPIFFEKTEKIIQNAKTQKLLEIGQN